MKKEIASVFIAALLATACTKERHGADDALPATERHGGGTEDKTSSGGRIGASDVPATVLNAFNTQFPNATRTEWKKLSNGNYKVQFVSGSVRYEATYTPAGTRVKLERA